MPPLPEKAVSPFACLFLFSLFVIFSVNFHIISISCMYYVHVYGDIHK